MKIMNGRIDTDKQRNKFRNEISDFIIQKWKKEPTMDFIENGECYKAMHLLA